MDFNKCPYCGAKLTDLDVTLSDEELKNWEYINSLISNAETALSPNIINKLNFEDSQLFTYFTAVFDQLAKGNFLKWSFTRDLKKWHNLDENAELFIIQEKVYSHGNL